MHELFVVDGTTQKGRRVGGRLQQQRLRLRLQQAAVRAAAESSSRRRSSRGSVKKVKRGLKSFLGY